MYVERYIEPVVHEHLAHGGVVIIEGARSVGKTRLLHRLYEQGRLKSIIRLHDANQLAAARRDPLTWLRARPEPFAIDEAQLLPELPLALKQLLDERHDQVRCILTGSASIGRTGLGGADPLARRAVRLTLEPLTEAELLSAGQPLKSWSAIEQLVHGTPDVSYALHETDWADALLKGGLPRYRLDPDLPRVGLTGRIRGDIANILGRDVLPGERWDTTRGMDVVNRVLRNPAGELKATRIAGEVELHRDTVNRYIDIAEARFLISELPNLHRPVKQSSRSTAKAYPADVALSSAALGISRVKDVTDTQLGGLFEAMVVQQLRAHLAWSAPGYSLHHWRRHISGRTVEVDVVIQDPQGRLTPVEIKSGEALRPDAVKAIESFAEHHSERFNRGVIIRGGGAAVPLGEHIWSIPFTALVEPQHWLDLPTISRSTQEPLPVTVPTPAGPRTAGVFMSYAHGDAAATYGRNMRQFVEDVIEALDGVFDKQVQLFYDVKDGVWEEELWGRLEDELQSTTFFVPFITPRYLRSEACVREFTRFSEVVAAQGRDGQLLPLIWIEPPAFRENPPIPLVQRIRDVRYLDVSAVRNASRDSQEYAEAVERVAEQLNRVIEAREESAKREVSSAADAEADVKEGTDLVEALATVEDMTPRLDEAMKRWEAAFKTLTPELGALFTGLEGLTPQQIRGRMMASARRLKGPSDELTEASDDLAATWDTTISALRFASQVMAEVGQPLPAKHIAEMEAVADELNQFDLQEAELVAEQLPIISSLLVPTSRGITRAINTLRQIESSARAWVEQERAREERPEGDD